ncbi:hypothetical protein J6590_080866 [Homalodisca vitripennis]|nr:hypothetical protein J6590_080866 [Homalodisca vitripennis]
MMSSVVLFVSLCMVLMEVITSSQLKAKDNEMFAFLDGQSGDGPPGKRDMANQETGRLVKEITELNVIKRRSKNIKFSVSEDNEMFAFPDGQSGDGPPGKRDMGNQETGRLVKEM